MNADGTNIKRSVVKRRRRKRPILLWICIGLIIIICGILVVQGYKIVQLKQEQNRVEQQLMELREKNAQLEADKARLQDPKQLEAVAREELGLVKPGEVPYVK